MAADLSFERLYSSTMTTARGRKRRRRTTAALPPNSAWVNINLLSMMIISIRNPARAREM